MSKFFTKVEVPQAVQGSTKIKLANQHITTNEFMRFSVGTFMPVIPKTRFSLSSRTFVRMNPLAHPVYGTATVKKKLFFVPFRTIYPAWNDFIENAVHNYNDQSAIVSHVPEIKMGDLISLFMTENYSTPTTNNSYDFTDYLGAKRNFMPLGKFAYHILTSLGYKVDFTNPVAHVTSGVNYSVSGLKLLCLARIYCDYYYNVMYTNHVNYQKVMRIFTDNSTNSLRITQEQLGNIFAMLHYTFYQDDYFTTAFDNPVGPVNHHEGIGIVIKDITNSNVNNTKVVVGSNNTPHTTGNQGGTQSSNVYNLTEYINNALKKLTNYFRRNAFVGGRASARHLAEFGIQLNDEQNNRSVYVDGYDFDIMFSDIMSNADTSGASLGAYAGKGIGQGEKANMTYFNNEFGYYMEIYHITPRVGYYQGMTKDTFQMNLFDFYHGDMDNLGMDAVRQAELTIPMKNPITINDQRTFKWSDLTQKVFGFQPRYLGEYKNKHDCLSGDFLLGSINAGMDAWHMMRVVNTFQYIDVGNTEEIDIVHSYDFTRSRNPEQWSRIFATNKIDNFIINHQYWYEITAPMKSAYDMLDFEDYNKRITMDLQGRKEA